MALDLTPVDYSLGQVADPYQAGFRGFSQGMVMQNALDQREQQKIAQQQAQMAAEAAARKKAVIDAELQALRDKKGATAEDYARVMNIDPATLSEPLKRTWEVLDGAQKTNRLKNVSRIFYSLDGNRPDIAKRLLRQEADTKREQGMEEDAVKAEEMIKAIDAGDIDGVKVLAGAELFSAPGAEKIGEAQGKIGEESRAAEKAPATKAKLEAEAAKLQSEAIQQEDSLLAGKVASLAAKPNVTQNEVAQTLLKASARGEIPKEKAMEFLKGMPKDSKALAAYLSNASLGGMSNIERYKALNPGIEEVDLGDRIIMVDRDGNLKKSFDKGVSPDAALSAKNAGSKAGTVAEQQAAFNATRIERAQNSINQVTGNNPGAESPNWYDVGVNLLWEPIANTLRRPDRQVIEAAQGDGLDAALNLATGASYTETQFQNLKKAFFPQLGDDEKTISSKRQALQVLLNAARIRAGDVESSIDTALKEQVDAIAKGKAPDGEGKKSYEKYAK